MRKSIAAIILTGVMIFMSACTPSSSPAPGAAGTPAASPTPTVNENTPGNTSDAKNPIVTITMDDDSQIILELYPDKAPNTVANFVTLASEGFYDGLIFHRTSASFMIQGGDPQGTGMGGPDYSIAGEFASNGFTQNDISHVRGVISMARSGQPDSAGSQFFIMVQDSEFLDNDYAGFGMVTSGLDAVDSIAAGPNTGGQEMRALEPRTMKSVTVETFGVEYTLVKGAAR